MAEEDRQGSRRQVKEEQDSPVRVEDREPVHAQAEWCQPLRDYLEEERAPAEVLSFLRELVGELDSPLSGYLSIQAEMESDLPTEKAPEATEPLPLLPVRLSAVREFLKDKDENLMKWVVSMVEVLTCHALMGKPKIGPQVLTPAQEFMVTRLYQAVSTFAEQEGKVPEVPKCKEALGAVKFG